MNDVKSNMSGEKVCIVADHVVNALGFSTEEVADAMKTLRSGCQLVTGYSDATTLAMLGLIDKTTFQEKYNVIAPQRDFTFFEQLMVFSIQSALNQTNIDPKSNRVLFLFSTTKGNIELLAHPHPDKERIHIWKSAQMISQYFGNPNTSLVISNACISGTQAVITAKHLLSTGLYEHIVVCGADCITKFVVSGFQSFKALSQQICKPFDTERDGLNIGEGAATLILSLKKENAEFIEVFSGAGANDANHISGPSRTGEGLFIAIEKALQNVDKKQLAFINAHGTATPYNDEMEAIAFSRSQIENVPTNSFKAYFGHTLGAAGLMETALSAYSLKHGFVFSSLGFNQLGVSVPLNVNTKLSETRGNYCLKTASGFGGCNAALVLKIKL
jgi:3-oxoacyl-[acyl-carrier-protein] synthase-1